MTTATSTGWAQPAPLALSRRRPMPLDSLPQVLQDLGRDRADALDVDPAMVVLPACSALATAGGSALIHLNKDWAEPGPIWTLLAADPGSRKSAALKTVNAPLMQVQHDAQAADAKTRTGKMVRVAHAESALKAAELAFKEALSHTALSPQDILNAEDAVNVAALNLDNVRCAAGDPPRLDAGTWSTSQKLHDRLAAHKNLSMFVPEGDTLFKGLLPGGGIERDIFLQSWSMEYAERSLVTRETRPAYDPSLNLCVVVQPQVVANNLKASNDLSATGFFDRFMVTVPFTGQVPSANFMDLGDTNGWNTVSAPSPAVQAWNDLITRHATATLPLRGEPQHWYLAPGAAKVQKHFYDQWAAYRGKYSSADAGALAKLNGQAARLARAFAIAEPEPVPGLVNAIGETAVQRGWTIAWWAFFEHEYLFGDALSDDLDKVRLCVQVLKKLSQFQDSGIGEVTITDLKRNGMGRYDKPALTGALNALVTGGWAKLTEPRYAIHPELRRWLTAYQIEGN